MESKNTKVVQFPFVARRLLKLGYQIVDLKPKKENRQKTLFVFKVEGEFQEDFSKIMDELRHSGTKHE